MRVATCLSSSLLCLPFLVLTTAPAAGQSPCGSYPQGAANYDCTCTGSESGSVWGTDIYTSDSNICVAARHAGVIGSGGGVVRLVSEMGQSAYGGSARNGVTTSNWGSYHSSFRFIEASVQNCGAFPSGTPSLSCGCTGNESGAVWGSGPYTSDSNICAAARHAGVIGAGGGVVHVLGMGGLPGYRGSAQNGVNSSNWGGYHSSYTFDLNR